MILGETYETIKSTSYMNVCVEWNYYKLNFVREHENLSCGINTNYEHLKWCKNETERSHESGLF